MNMINNSVMLSGGWEVKLLTTPNELIILHRVFIYSYT